jgi:hypothetical protein
MGEIANTRGQKVRILGFLRYIFKHFLSSFTDGSILLLQVGG